MEYSEIFNLRTGTHLYILTLQNNKFYVGISKNLFERIHQHIHGKTNYLVKNNLPIKKCQYIYLENQDLSDCMFEETKKTIELIHKYGFDNVCGGLIVGKPERRLKIYHTMLKKYADLLNQDISAPE